MNAAGLTIGSVRPDALPAFFEYLDDHLRDNGEDAAPLFQPMARGDSRLPDEKRSSFSAGLAAPLGQPGWRRAWVAVDAQGTITGHIDLRARPEPAAAHRALLGMGVHLRIDTEALAYTYMSCRLRPSA